MTIVSTGQLTLTDLNDTKQLILYLNSTIKTQIYDADKPSGTATSYNPNFVSVNPVITPELFISGGGGSNLLPTLDALSVTWYEGSQTVTPIAEGTTTNYIIPTGAIGTTLKTLSLRTNFASKNSQLLTCVVVFKDVSTGFDITAKASVEIVKVTSGTAGTQTVTGFLTNESTVVSTNFDGTGGAFGANTATTLRVFEGITDITGSYTINQAKVGVTVTEAVTSATATVTAMSVDTGWVEFTATRASYPTIVKRFNIAKSRVGNAGTTPSSYWLTTNDDMISKNVAGAFLPISITATSNVQVGDAVPNRTTSMKWLIGVSTNGTAFTNGSVLTGATATTLAFGATIQAIRFRMYLSTTATPSDTNFVDEQVIRVISDGQTGTDAFFLNVWTPDGDTYKNGLGTLPIKADLYKGSSTVTPSAHKWYEQDPTATTGSGGDADGGNGWRVINTVATATTAPTLAMVANTNTKLTAGTYFVKYTWGGLSGETLGNTTQVSLVVTANNDLRVTIPAFVTNARRARVYVGMVTGDANLRYQGEITVSSGNLIITSLDTVSELLPTVNTATAGAVTGATLNVRGWAVDGMEGFKAVATFETLKYSGLVILKDIADLIHVDIVGVSTFKNGDGSTQLTARLMQNGSQIPATGYSFSWAVYNSDGTLAVNIGITATDTVTVLASQVNGRGVLVCDVRKL